MPPRAVLATLVLAAAALPALAGEEHRIEVELKPETSEIVATDRITLDGVPAFGFYLNNGLHLDGAKLDGEKIVPEGIAIFGTKQGWTVPLKDSRGVLEIRYSGKIADAVKKSADLSFVVGDDSSGVICPDGVYLTKESGWYPVSGEMARFSVKATIPAPYLVVTQGTHADLNGFWTGKYDADGLALVAGKWKHEEKKTAGGVVVGTYLTETNSASAKLFLDATEGYLAKYSELLGPYPYDRFDVVENWFTTGYGMPEFTLLGRDVLARMSAESQRLGSIPSGYLDHEIVHSWWGNGVFPDFEKGNWCEGVTSYCANYMSQEWKSADDAREYRRRLAVRFTIRAKPERDYPVRPFHGKVEDVDDDIGYGKCSMIFHALRRDLGEAPFWDTLRRIGREYTGKRFTWADWQREFEKTSRRRLNSFFEQALDRRGAPLFAVRQPSVSAEGGRLRVQGTLVQILDKDEKPWRVTVPVVVEHLEGREELLVDCGDAETGFSVLVPSLPLRVIVDPDFQTFRRLAADEVPPCLAATLERPNKLIVYPDGDDALKAAAEMAAGRAGGKAIPASQAPTEAPKGTSLLVFGDTARVPLLASLAKKLTQHFPTQRSTETTTILASARNPADENEFVTTFVGQPAIVAKRARAVFYYQYDGRVVFDGSTPKDRSQVATINHAARTLLPDILGSSSPQTCREVIDRLAAPEMNGRLAGSSQEKKVRALIAEQFTLAGCEVGEQAFWFVVKGFPPLAIKSTDGPSHSDNTSTWHGAKAFVASPDTGGKDVHVGAIVTEPERDLAGNALLVELSADQEDVLTSLRSAASLAKSRGAVALLVRLPDNPPRAITDLLVYPGDLMPSKPGDSPTPVPPYVAAGVAARTGSMRSLALPTVALPFHADVHVEGFSLAIQPAPTQVSSANVIGRIKATTGKRRPGVVVLSAHFDHLGAGFPGADDNASGIAALTEAARVLSANSQLLARDVVLVAFGAEEWGLRGSKAFVEAWPQDKEPIVAVINADTVGRREVKDVNVVGITKYPRLGKLVAAALEQSTLDVGKDIDQYAFAWGSDHWSFHEAGIPAVDLWSGDYKVMHTAADTADQVDEKKVSRVGRAMALAAFAAAGGF